MSRKKINKETYRIENATVDIHTKSLPTGTITYNRPARVVINGDKVDIVPRQRESDHRNEILFDEDGVTLRERENGSMYVRSEVDLCNGKKQVAAFKKAMAQAAERENNRKGGVHE